MRNSNMKMGKSEHKSSNGSEENQLTKRNKEQRIQKRCSTIFGQNPHRISPRGEKLGPRKMKELRRLCSRNIGMANTVVKITGNQLTKQKKEQIKHNLCVTTLSRTKKVIPRKRRKIRRLCFGRKGRVDPMGPGKKPKIKWMEEHEALPPPPQPQPQPPQQPQPEPQHEAQPEQEPQQPQQPQPPLLQPIPFHIQWPSFFNDMSSEGETLTAAAEAGISNLHNSGALKTA